MGPIRFFHRVRDVFDSMFPPPTRGGMKNTGGISFLPNPRYPALSHQDTTHSWSMDYPWYILLSSTGTGPTTPPPSVLILNEIDWWNHDAKCIWSVFHNQRSEMERENGVVNHGCEIQNYFHFWCSICWNANSVDCNSSLNDKYSYK